MSHNDVENCPYEGGKCTPIDSNEATSFDSSEVLSLMEVMTDYVFKFDPGNIPLPSMPCAIQPYSVYFEVVLLKVSDWCHDDSGVEDMIKSLEDM